MVYHKEPSLGAALLCVDDVPESSLYLWRDNNSVSLVTFWLDEVDSSAYQASRWLWQDNERRCEFSLPRSTFLSDLSSMKIVWPRFFLISHLTGVKVMVLCAFWLHRGDAKLMSSRNSLSLAFNQQVYPVRRKCWKGQRQRFIPSSLYQSLDEKENIDPPSSAMKAAKLSGPPFHYIFGYGSLLCAKSRALTAPETQSRIATIVNVTGIQRVWAKQSQIGMTAIGIRFHRRTTTAGVILPVDDVELPKFDLREKGYTRLCLEIDQVTPVVTTQSNQHDHVFRDAQNRAKRDDLKIWAYFPDLFVPANAQYPILQSYVDTILRGCFDIGGKDFAKEFIKGTKGWNPGELAEYYDKNTMSYGPVESCWINDRENPLYSRGDPAHSQANADMFDALLKKCVADAFASRTELPRTEETPPHIS